MNHIVCIFKLTQNTVSMKHKTQRNPSERNCCKRHEITKESRPRYDFKNKSLAAGPDVHEKRNHSVSSRADRIPASFSEITFVALWSKLCGLISLNLFGKDARIAQSILTFVLLQLFWHCLCQILCLVVSVFWATTMTGTRRPFFPGLFLAVCISHRCVSGTLDSVRLVDFDDDELPVIDLDPAFSNPERWASAAKPVRARKRRLQAQQTEGPLHAGPQQDEPMEAPPLPAGVLVLDLD